MKTFADKVVVVTGAGSGIGRALALDIAAREATLALSDWDAASLRETAHLVRERTGTEPRTDVLDVRDRARMREYAAAVHRDLGKVNVLINNAGVALQGDFSEVTYEQFDWVMDVDFWGVVQGTKEFLPYLIESGDGHLVNLSSLFGLMGIPGQTAYNSAKFAVRGFTEALRQEMLIAGHKVGVTCVHPGGVKTAIARNARMTTAADHDAFAEFFDRHLARTSAEDAAAQIVEGVLRSRPRVVVGADAKFLDLLVRLLGPRYQRVVAMVSSRTLRRGVAQARRRQAREDRELDQRAV